MRCRWTAFLLAGALGLTACGASGGAGENASGVIDGERIASSKLVEKACEEGTVVYYTAQTGEDEQKIADKFQEDFDCIDVKVVRAVTGQMYERITTEAGASKVGGDVTILTDAYLLEQLVKKKLLAKWDPPSADKYGESRKNAGYWYAASASIMYFIYNNQSVSKKNAPKDWEDLLDPRWKNKIAAAAPTIGGTGWNSWWQLRERLDVPNYWERMAKQKPRLYTSYSSVVTAVARGELPIGIECDLCDYPTRTQQGAPLTPVYPKSGVAYVPYGMGLLKGAKHPNAGELFANWYLSKRGQKSLVDVRGAYSARDDVAPAKGKPPLKSLKVYTPPLATVSEQHDQLIEDFEKAFGHR